MHDMLDQTQIPCMYVTSMQALAVQWPSWWVLHHLRGQVKPQKGGDPSRARWDWSRWILATCMISTLYNRNIFGLIFGMEPFIIIQCMNGSNSFGPMIENNPNHLWCASKERTLKDAPEGLPQNPVKIPAEQLAPEVVGAKDCMVIACICH